MERGLDEQLADTDDIERRAQYDPFGRGRFPVGVVTVDAPDAVRGRVYPCEIWYPATPQYAGQDVAPETQDFFPVPGRDTPRRQAAVRDAAVQPGTYPLVVYSHHGLGHRRVATFLCTHLASHGYVVAALDHSEVVAEELAPQPGQSAEQRAPRIAAWIANRVPDIRLLLDRLLTGAWESATALDPTRIGIVGHSFGGWTALAAPDVERRIQAVVAHAPGGTSQPRPGIIPVKLAFNWGRDVPTLYLAAEQDVPVPLAGVDELFDRTPGSPQMVVLRRADHQHFVDEVEHEHEAARAMSFPEEGAWIPKAMLPIGELCSGEQAHLLVRGLTLCHLDATLRNQAEARRLLAGDVEAHLAARGVEAMSHKRTKLPR
jgi:dienelactone hydrolase